MKPLSRSALPIFAASLFAVSSFATEQSETNSQSQAADAAPAIYMTCSRDGVMGKPGEPLACLQVRKKDESTVCSGSGSSEICADSYYSLCKAAGDAASEPMNDQGGKGTFDTREACMAKCEAEGEAWGALGGHCVGDITPK